MLRVSGRDVEGPRDEWNERDERESNRGGRRRADTKNLPWKEAERIARRPRMVAAATWARRQSNTWVYVRPGRALPCLFSPASPPSKRSKAGLGVSAEMISSAGGDCPLQPEPPLRAVEMNVSRKKGFGLGPSVEEIVEPRLPIQPHNSLVDSTRKKGFSCPRFNSVGFLSENFDRPPPVQGGEAET
jgi:hypothetical protein